MKKIGLIGAGLLSVLAHGGKWLQSAPATMGYSAPFYRKEHNDTQCPRHWHNPADPVQVARIEAAAAKRERKADVLHDWACRSRHFNKAHHEWHGPFPSASPSAALNILY